jgi:hypothetical protein
MRGERRGIYCCIYDNNDGCSESDNRYVSNAGQ